jgi:hypothetical protein
MVIRNACGQHPPPALHRTWPLAQRPLRYAGAPDESAVTWRTDRVLRMPMTFAVIACLICQTLSARMAAGQMRGYVMEITNLG